MGHAVDRWTVQYGDEGPREIRVPHAWRQDVALDWEGPALYRTMLEVPKGRSALRFHGVSYACRITVGGRDVGAHEGIWDAFDVDLSAYGGTTVEVGLEIVKNGGRLFPVASVLSGFLPYVYGTWGGPFRAVELVTDAAPLEGPIVPSRVSLCDGRIEYDDAPRFVRGLLHWGWYPETGAPTPTDAEIEKELATARDLGFNLIKFCLWLPPHRYLEALDAAGMMAWIELPLWAADETLFNESRIEEELERIVRQYRRHRCIAAWTVGCELGNAPAAFRERMVAKVEALTGCPLVRDNSGGAEMYGGDPREFGTFEDFHPYTDLPIYPAMLDSLALGTHDGTPILLGETMDADVHRDLPRIARRLPYWASALSELNAKGVRWLYDLPRQARELPVFADEGAERDRELRFASIERAAFVRRAMAEAVRARPAFSGYVVTGLRDTPISTSGLVDDFGGLRYSPEAMRSWNGPTILFLNPMRRAPWRIGGNVPRTLDPHCVAPGSAMWRVSGSSESGASGRAIWRIRDAERTVVAEGVGAHVELPPLSPRDLVEIHWLREAPGHYELEVEFGDVHAAWPILVVAPADESIPLLARWDREAEARFAANEPAIVQVGPEAPDLVHAPFWRECAPLFDEVPAAFAAVRRPEFQLGVSVRTSLDAEAWAQRLGEGTPLMRRVDLRDYRQSAYALRARNLILTTLPLAERPDEPWTPQSAAPALFRSWFAAVLRADAPPEDAGARERLREEGDEG